MKKTLFILVLTSVMAMFSAACWSPSVTEVPITAPWDKMNLPIKEDARVWGSTDKELKVVYKARKADVAKNYLEALEKNGWKLVEKAPVEELIIWDFEKNGQRLKAQIYDFENTGVILELK